MGGPDSRGGHFGGGRVAWETQTYEGPMPLPNNTDLENMMAAFDRQKLLNWALKLWWEIKFIDVIWAYGTPVLHILWGHLDFDKIDATTKVSKILNCLPDRLSP